jgi:hypothetical protein
VKGQTRHSLGYCDDTAGPRGFTVAVDRDAAQITLRGRATGAGGGAYLTPVPGVELVFDRADGWLSGVTVAADRVSDKAAGWIADVFGPAAAAAVRKAPHGNPLMVPLRARPGTLKALSRLARLDAARVTSPVPAAPLWVAEAAALARHAGLTRPGQPLTAATEAATLPGGFGSTIPAHITRPPADDGPAPWAGALPGARSGGGRLEGSLDPGLVPHGVFLPGLWPGADLKVRAGRDGARLIVVETALLPGATPAELAGCRARLVNANERRVLATAAFRSCPPSPADAKSPPGTPRRAWAELPTPTGLRTLTRSGTAWVEVVGDERRTADGTRLRRIRRALRWADAALRAESQPNGLAPELSDEQWIRMTALAWNRCRADWAAAGDPGRAALAAARSATVRHMAGRSATERRGTTVGRAHPFLAELVGDPAVLP